ncbi:MAG: DsbA family oxidoreductase [Myxococcota bacterium]
MSLSIRVVSDIVCPWCFVGHRRLDEALRQLQDVQVDVDWRPYQLNPHVPREGVPFREHYERKFGRSVDAFRARMEDAGHSAGISFRFDRVERVPNTLAAHTVIGWAPPGVVRSAVVERFFEGYFLEGRDMGDPAVLAELAAEAGLVDDDVAERLLRDDDRERVAREADANRRSGITGVPFFMVGERYPVVGAQSADTMVKVIERVLQRQAQQASEQEGAQEAST